MVMSKTQTFQRGHASQTLSKAALKRFHDESGEMSSTIEIT